jgi:hypothetical protein
MPRRVNTVDSGMRERAAQIVLLVRAFEESDREGRILSPYTRMVATRRALAVTGLSDFSGELAEAAHIRSGETVMRRARLLFNGLVRKLPFLPRVLKVAQLGSSTGPVIIGAALLFGVLTNLLGTGRRINLLSFPLLGLLAWNLAIYLFMAVGGSLRRIRQRPAGRRRLSVRLTGWLMRGALGRRLRGRRFAQGGETGITTKALLRFAGLWDRVAAPLLVSRVRRVLHVGAAAVMVGAIAGMYVRGLAFEYQATWESTWLDVTQVQALLGTVLGPASRVLGLSIPDVTPLRGPDGAGPAAPWINLYAMTTLLFVVLPRTALVLYETWRGARMAARIPVDLNDSYFRGVFTAWRGATRLVRIVPYSFTAQPGGLDALKRLLHDFFGARADIRIRAPLDYGDDAETLMVPGYDVEDGERETAWVVLFNLAQSPEAEVHGRFLEELRATVESRGGQILVLVDVSAYHRTIDAPERRTERSKAWSRVVDEAGLNVVEVAFDRLEGDEILDAVAAARWRAGDAVEGTAG